MNNIMNLLNYSNENLCRTCGSPGLQLEDIFIDSNKVLLKKLRACVDINFDVNDALPKKICMKCIKDLNSAYKFRIQCEHTELKFHEAISEARLVIGDKIVTVRGDLMPSMAVTHTIDSLPDAIKPHDKYDMDFVVKTVPDQASECVGNDVARIHEDNSDGNESIKEYYLEEVPSLVEQYNTDNVDVDNIIENNRFLDASQSRSSKLTDHSIKYITDHSHLIDISLAEHSGGNSDTEEIEYIYDDLSNDNLSSNEMIIVDDDQQKKDSREFNIIETVEYHSDDNVNDDRNVITLSISDEKINPEEKSIDFQQNFKRHIKRLSEKNSETINSIPSVQTNQCNDTEKKTLYIKKFNCDTCKQDFLNYREFNEHKRSHGQQRYQCDTCKRWFSKRYHLISHLAIHNQQQLSYGCNMCDKTYSNQGNLDRHVRVFHQKVKQHVCVHCNKSFSQSSILKLHYYVHTNERNYECDICNKRYKSLEYLRAHKERHLPGELKTIKKQRRPPSVKSNNKQHKAKRKTFVCTTCGKRSSSTALHYSHMRTHSGEQPYECPECKRKFSFQQSLRNHMLLHTGAKPYKCDICNISFRQSGHLKGHKLIHSGEKQHKCMICEKTFALRGNLTVHMRLHTGETPYHCNICPKKFYDSGCLKRHKNIHFRKQDDAQIIFQEESQEQEASIKNDNAADVYVDVDDYSKHLVNSLDESRRNKTGFHLEVCNTSKQGNLSVSNDNSERYADVIFPNNGDKS